MPDPRRETGRWPAASPTASLAGGLAMLLVCAGAGCGGFTLRSDYNPTVDLASYRTYAWVQGDRGSAVDELDRSLIGQRVRLQVDRDLAAKGLRRVERGQRPDFVVAARLASRERLDNYDWGYPGATWSAYETADVYGEQTKGVLLEFLDPTRHKVIWWGAVRGRFDPTARSAEVERAMRTLLAQYPPAPRG